MENRKEWPNIPHVSVGACVCVGRGGGVCVCVCVGRGGGVCVCVCGWEVCGCVCGWEVCVCVCVEGRCVGVCVVRGGGVCGGEVCGCVCVWGGVEVCDCAYVCDDGFFCSVCEYVCVYTILVLILNRISAETYNVVVAVYN